VAKPGAVLALEAKVGKFYRVAWEPGRTGFIPAEAGVESPAKVVAKKGEVEHAFQHHSPQIKLASIDPLQGGIQTLSDKFTLAGTATDPSSLRDLYIFVNDQKVFFRTSAQGGTTNLDFSTEFPLKLGNNTVLVVAREDDEFVGRRTLIIHRGGTEVAQQMPK
jgi:carboxyl-terminal processing protease